jgi:radical SAM protein with 4Fe4S-binding SPASM domain
MFIQYAGADEFNPIISINNEPVYDVSKYDEEFTQNLESVLSEIFDSSIPFTPTTDTETCKNCPYRQLCNN